MKIDKHIIILIVGVDGVGKTTIAKAVADQIASDGKDVEHVWSRYRNYISKPFLAIMRLTGHNRKEVIDGVKIGYHNFSNNHLISWIFLVLQWIDQFIDISLRYKIKSTNIVSDRCVIDTLIDLCVDTGMDDFILGAYGKSLIKMMPKNTIYCVIFREKSLVLETRSDVAIDRNYERRVKLYQRAAKDFEFNVIINDGGIEDAVRKIMVIADGL